MSMSATPERPCKPQPAFNSLPAAVEAYLDHGNLIPPNLARWAQTYGCKPDRVEAEFIRQRQKRSLTPCPSQEFEGK
jgi:hypothetical protein